MARGRKPKEKVEKTIKLKASELKQAVIDASRHKAEAAEWTGRHGKGVALFVERTGFDRVAFGWLRKLHDLGDDLKRQSIIRQFLMGVELLGFKDQGDLFDAVKSDLADKVDHDDDGEEEEDLRPDFLKNAMPLDEAEAAFAKNADKAPKPDALSALAGEDDGFGAATQEVTAEETSPVTKGGTRTRVSKAELEAANKAGKAEVRGIGDVVLN